MANTLISHIQEMNPTKIHPHHYKLSCKRKKLRNYIAISYDKSITAVVLNCSDSKSQQRREAEKGPFLYFDRNSRRNKFYRGVSTKLNIIKFYRLEFLTNTLNSDIKNILNRQYINCTYSFRIQ